MTYKTLMLVVIIASITIVPAYAQNIGAELNVVSGYQNTSFETIVCGSGECFAMITVDTSSGFGEVVYGTSGNSCLVTLTLIENGSATTLASGSFIDRIASIPFTGFAVGDLIQIANIYTSCS